MLNKVILMGNVGLDPKISLTQEGKEIATFSLATSTSWKDETGGWQTFTDWHRIIVFRESTVRWIKDILKKGDCIYIEGKLTYQHWKDKYGQSRLTSHVVISGAGGKVQYLHFPFSTRQNEATVLNEKDSPICESKDSHNFPFEPLEISQQSQSSTHIILLPKEECIIPEDVH